MRSILFFPLFSGDTEAGRRCGVWTWIQAFWLQSLPLLSALTVGLTCHSQVLCGNVLHLCPVLRLDFAFSLLGLIIGLISLRSFSLFWFAGEALLWLSFNLSCVVFYFGHISGTLVSKAGKSVWSVSSFELEVSYFFFPKYLKQILLWVSCSTKRCAETSSLCVVLSWSFTKIFIKFWKGLYLIFNFLLLVANSKSSVFSVCLVNVCLKPKTHLWSN